MAAKSSCGEAPSAAAAELATLRKTLATRDAEIAALRAEIASSRAAATVQLIPVAKTPERTPPQEQPAAIVVDASRLNREALQAVSTGDYRAAVAKFRRAAELDDAAAMANLGTMYLNGTGVSQDAHQALQLLVKAANKGNRTAAENLGTLCEYGLSGVAQNPVRAYQWYEVAARLGSTTVQTSMARIRGDN
ncbi:tetratricopeptide repeat protein [Rhodanobacter thiooxydans]|uniref:tetratricopeptide repeat protein n=1 Tax=Rhodanobacter thiooxydans TaxID=416169 RepID=UPI001F2FEFD9|nr:tetratricopeptide repeat protein [Rhodanobacter thiooxydans]UJJ56755.1 sel1 repeat family protein [Rhodanobacter thiooxydans]